MRINIASSVSTRRYKWRALGSAINENNGKNHLLRIPVPWVYVIAYLAGIAIQFVFPLPKSSFLFLIITLVFGSLLLLIGAAIAVWAQWIFRKENTTTDPTQTSAKLVTWGPYKFSRNPMYLGLFLAFMGVDMILTFVWSLVLLIFVLYYVNWIVIPVEEKQLQKTFGETYVQYCMKVRRWL